jgi:amino-acid N-acetyltransferase
MHEHRIERGPGREAVMELLMSASLPSADLTDAHMAHFFYCGSSSAPLGIVGVEFYGSDALLRSLAVAPDRQRTGLGRALLHQAEHHARSRGAGSIYLLTTTAESFFKKHGYVPAERAAAPQGIRTSREFADLCPATSAFLVKHLS